MTRRCDDCGAVFTAAGDWQRLCRSCYREMKDRESADLAANAYDRGYADGLRDGGDADLDPELLRDLVALCHPDRHPAERFERANRATAALLGLLNGDGS